MNERPVFSHLHIGRRKFKRYLPRICVFIIVLVFYYYISDHGRMSFQEVIMSCRNSIAITIPYGYILQGTLVEKIYELYQKINYDTSPIWFDEYSLKENLLTVRIGPEKGKKLSSIDELEFYDSDPRLVWSTYLSEILRNSKGSDQNLMPFSWYDWIDFHDYNKLLSIKKIFGSALNCDLVLLPVFNLTLLNDMEAHLGEPLFTEERIKYNDRIWYRSASRLTNNGVGENDCSDDPESINNKFRMLFKVNRLNDYTRAEVFALNARDYILNTAPLPQSLILLNGESNTYRINIDGNERNNLVQSGILKNLINESMDAEGNYKFDHIEMFEKFVNSALSEKLKIDIPETDNSIYESNNFDIPEESFMFEPRAKIEELENKYETLSNQERNYLKSLKVSVDIAPADAPKYFREADNIKQFKGAGRHRDIRFFSGSVPLNSLEYKSHLNSMIRTFQKLMKSTGLVSWLSHGSLYGYEYNGLTFPWDNDFDIQMPIRDLNLLAQYFNQSLVLEDPREGNGRFLVDVGSSITSRIQGNGNNNIDARFIDINTGIYIDITGLSVSSEPYMMRKVALISEERGKEVREKVESMKSELGPIPEYSGNEAVKHEQFNANDKDNKDKIDFTFLTENLNRTEIYHINKELGLVNCRNKHFSRIDMISPLRTTIFHGVTAFIPHLNIESLKDEYKIPEKYGFLTFKDKVFLPQLRSWFSFVELRNTANINGANPTLYNIKSPINDLIFEDLELIYKNMIKSEYTGLFSSLYNEFNMTAYHLKEMEIYYDERLSQEVRENALALLRREVAPSITSPLKDPILLKYEQRLWETYKHFFSKGKINSIKKVINFTLLKKLWQETHLLWSRDLYTILGDKAINNLGKNLLRDVNTEGEGVFKLDRV